MTEIYITSEHGTLVAEANCVKVYELCEVIEAHDVGFGESYLLDTDTEDVWELADEFETFLDGIGL